MSLQTEKKYKLPVLVPKDPTPADMKTASGKNKYWYINVPFYDESKKEFVDVPFKKGINYHKKFKDRLKAAHSLIDSLVELLEKGWNPITQTMPAAKLADPKNNPISNLSLSKAMKWALDNKKVKKSSKKEYGVCYKAINQISKKVKAPTEEGGEAYFDFSQLPIKEVRKFHVKLILDEGFRSGWSKHNYNKMLGGIQALFKELVTIEVFEHNPAHDIPYLVLPESDKYKSITNEEFKRKIREELFLDHFNFYVYLMTLYHSGMRPHEALALRISDVELDKRKITIVPEEIAENSKTKSKREIPIADELYLLLDYWLGQYGDRDKSFYLFGSPFESGKGNKGSTTQGRGAMHPNYFEPSKVRIKRDTVTRLWKRLIREKYGVEHYMYDMKYTGGDDKILNGADLDALRDLYGHQTKRMSERYAKRLKEVFHKNIIEHTAGFFKGSSLQYELQNRGKKGKTSINDKNSQACEPVPVMGGFWQKVG